MAPGQVSRTQCYIEEQSPKTPMGKYSSNKTVTPELTLNIVAPIKRRMQGSKETKWWMKSKSKNFIGEKLLNIRDYYFPGPELGKGSYGMVIMCAEKNMLAKFACKSILKNHVDFDMEDLQREVAIIEHLPPHSNIIALEGAYDDDIAVHLVMELCEGGELQTRIEKKDYYTEHGAGAVIRMVMEVVETCHDHGVMHRDLKPDNFLFVNIDEDSPLKAIDFGMSVFFKPGKRFTEFAGSPLYMAPEVYKRDYGPEVDIWSAGVILYVLLCGEFPFEGEIDTEMLEQKILHGDLDLSSNVWKTVSPSAKSLVWHMLDRNPKTRYTAKEVLNHQWLQIHTDNTEDAMCSVHTNKRRRI